MTKKIARDEELQRKRARRYADLLAAQEAARSITTDSQAPRPPSSALSRISRKEEEVRRAFASTNFDLMRMHGGVGNDAIRNTLNGGNGAGHAARQEERPGAALLDALLAREAVMEADAGVVDPTSDADYSGDAGYDGGDADFGDIGDDLAGDWDAGTESMSFGGSAPIAPTHVTVRDELAGLDVTYDLAGGAPDVDLSQVKQNMGGGSPLDTKTREYMEWRFGVSFEKVRVHTGPKADAMSKALFAHAFALGADVAFQSNTYRPGTVEGDRLLAHELTHVVQAGLTRPLTDAEHRALGGGKGAFKTTENTTALSTKSVGTADLSSLSTLAKSGSVSSPTDSFEIEADNTADLVVRHGRAEQARVRRELASQDAREREEEKKQQQNGAAAKVDAALQAGGRSLPADVKGKLESLFGRSLDGVKIHDDHRAAEAAEAVQAHAFTVGQDVVFGAGEFRPGTTEGDALIAHEVTHVVQNMEGRGGHATQEVDGVGVTSVGDSVEREAYAVGDAVALHGLDGAAADSAFAPVAARTVTSDVATEAVARDEAEASEEIKFTLNLGNRTQRITIPASQASGSSYSQAINGIPGILDPATARLDLSNNQVTGGTLSGTLAAPELRGGITLQISASGNVSGSQEVDYSLTRFARGQVTVTFSNGALTARKTLSKEEITTYGDEAVYSEASGSMMMSGLGTISATASGSGTLAEGKLTGEFSVRYRNEAANGSFSVKPTYEQFDKIWQNGQAGDVGEKPTLVVRVADGRLEAEEETFAIPAQGNGVSGTSNVTLSYAPGEFSGGGDGNFSIGDWITGTTNVTFGANGDVNGSFSASTTEFDIGPLHIGAITLSGGLNQGNVNLTIGGSMSAFNGQASGRFSGNITDMNDPQFTGALTVNLPAMSPTTVNLTYAGGNFSGSGTLTPQISGLSGSANLSFTGETFSASGTFDIAVPIVSNAQLEVAYEEGQITGTASIDAGSFNIAGVQVSESNVTATLGSEGFSMGGSASASLAGGLVTGTMAVDVTNSEVTASIDSTFNPPGVNPVDLHAEYSGGTFRGSASTAVNIPFTEAAELGVTFENGRFGGNVRADLNVPFLTGGSVQVTVDTDGTITGTVQVAARDVSIPGMTVTGVSVSGSIASTGHLSLQGTGTVTGIPAVHSANLTLGVSSSGFSGKVEADLAVPTMKSTKATIELNEDGSVSGSADVEAEIAGVTGAVHVEYAEGAFFGSGTLSYSRGKFEGSIEAAISREGTLSGTGRVSYAITDDLKVTGEVTLREDGTMVVGGQLECPDRIDLFEKEWKKTIFQMTGRFGIPGLSVQLPVVGVVGLEAQLSGKLEAYANVGLYLTNITAGGTFDTANNNVELDVGGEIRGEAAAGVSATARLAVGLGIGPAFIGGYVQIAGSAGIRAGIGAGVNAHYSSAEDVLSLGVNVNASAGLEFALEISGGITASVDLWLTKWEHDWPLASKTWSYNPGVNFDYNPSFDFNLGSEPSMDALQPSSEPSIDGNAMARQAGGQADGGSGGGGGSGARAKMDPNLVQAKGGESPAMAAAAHGIQGAGRPLPHLDKIQQSFGSHDVTGVKAHTDGRAAEAAKSMGAKAYATGNDVAFGSGGQDLHTAAHEAAHVVQQRAGVATKGGGGQDKWEQHADQVADAVVAGKSAEPLLDSVAGKGSGAVQQKSIQAKSLDGPVQFILGGGGVDFDISLGGRNIRLSVPVPELEGNTYTCALPSPITGIQNPQASLTLENGQVSGGTITGTFAWPVIQGDAAFGFSGDGNVNASITRQWNIAQFGAGDITLMLSNGDLGGSATVEGNDLNNPFLTVTEFTGDLTIGASGLTGNGSGNTSIANGLVAGAFTMGYDGTNVSGHVDGRVGLPSFVTAWAAAGRDLASAPELDLDLSASNWGGSVSIDFPVSVPGITGSASVNLGYNSASGFSGSGTGTFQIANFFGGSLGVTIDQGGGVGGTASVTTPTYELGPIGVSAIVVNGTITNGVLAGDASGSVSALNDMLSGTWTGSLANGFSFVPSINFTLPQMNQAALSLAYDANSGFSGSASITPSISFLSGTANTTFGGTDFTANGGFDLNAGFLQNTNIGIGWNDGLSGSITLQDQNFNLPHINVSGSSITATYNNDVTIDGSATMGVANLFDGTLNASWTGSDIDANGTGTLNPPGIQPVAFNFGKEGDNLTASATANISIPRVQATGLTVSYDGQNFSGGTAITLDIPYLESATGRVDVDQNGMSGEFAIQASSFNFSPLTISSASVTGNVRDGQMNLSGSATVSTDMPALEGTASVSFDNLDVQASGGFTFTSDMFGSASLDVAYADDRLTGSAAIQPNDITLPYITVSSSTIGVQLAEDFSVAGQATVAAGSFFSGTMSASYADNDIDANVAGNINAPGLSPIAITLSKQGDLISGSVTTAVNIPMVKSATIRAAYENGRFGGGVGVELDLPIVESATGNIDITPEGQVNGSITVEAGDIALPYMNVDSAAVTAEIQDGGMNLSGNATLSAEISALSGTATLSFQGSNISATGGFDLESGFFQSAHIGVQYEGGRVTGQGTINANNIDLPMLSVTSSSITVGLGENITVSGSAGVTAAGGLYEGNLNVNWTGSDIDGSVDGTFRPPGITPVTFNLTKQGNSISGTATVEPNIPMVESASFTVRYQSGQFGGEGRAELNLPIVDSAVGTVNIEPGGEVGGSITVNASDIDVPFFTIESASVTAAIENGDPSISGSATLGTSLPMLTGTAGLSFQGAEITGSGGFDINTAFFDQAHIGVSYENEAVTGRGTIGADSINVPVLTVTNSSITAEIGENFSITGTAGISHSSGLFDGQLTASYNGSDIDGSINGTFRPPGINPVEFEIVKQGDSMTGSATTTVNVPFTNGARLTINYDNGEFSGRADLDLNIPFTQGASAWVEVTNEGQINGGISVDAGNISLPLLTVNSATVEGEITNGVLRMEGSGSVSGIPMTRSCDFTLGINDGNFYGSVGVDLEIPFTERARGELEMNEDGSVSGSVNVRAALAGVTGDVTANYDQGEWSGTGTLEYNRGPFTGSITANLSAEGNLSGTGRVSYDITPDFTITAEVTMREDGSMEIGGRIDCPDKIDLFEQEYEKNIFNFMARFGIPGLSIQLPIVGVVGLEARLSGSLDVYASLGLYLTDIYASGTFDTATNDVELDIGGSIKGRAEAGMIAALRFAFGLGIGPAFIGGYIEASGKAGIFAELAAAVSAHYSSRANSLGLDIDLSASAGLAFEFGLEAGLMAEIDLWLFKWSADFPMASKTFQYDAGVSMDYSPSLSFDLLKGGTPSPDAISGGAESNKGLSNDDGKDIGGNAEPDDSERYKPCRNVTEKFDLDTEDEYEKGVLRLSKEVPAGDADRMRDRFGGKMAGFLSSAKLAEVGINFVTAGANLAQTLDWMVSHGAAKGDDVVKAVKACKSQSFKDELKNDDWKVKIQGLTNKDQIATIVDTIDAELEMKMRWMTEPGTTWALVLPRVEQAPQAQRDVLRTEEWMGIFTGFLQLSEVSTLVDLLGGDLTFKWTWIFAANTDYATLKEKAEAAPQGERDACRGDEWKGQVAGVTQSDEMAELVDIMGGDLHFKWDWMFAAPGPQYSHYKAKAEAAPEEERTACRTDMWLGRVSTIVSVDEMAELVDIMGGDLDYKWHWMFTPGTRWDHILAKAEAAPQNERDACRGDNWKPRVIAAVSEDEMAILVDVMGGDLAWKLDWMYDKGSNWGLIQPKVEAAPQGERDGVRNAEWKPRHLGMLVHDEIFILVDLLAGTFDEKWDWIFSSGTHYQAAKDKALSVSAGEYPQVMNDGWLARVITVTNADQMHEITGILGWDLETTLYWMISGGTRWDLVRDKIINAAGGDQQNLNKSAKRLRELESVFGWNEMAAAVELTGTLIPNAGQLQGDGAVKGAMESGWAKSNPFPGDPAKRHEEGGWFYLNLISGSISVVTTSGKQASIDLGAAPEVGDSILVGYFHTHPNPSTEPDESGKQWKADPSPADLAVASAFEVPAFIRADVGVIAYGPSQRPFMAGPKGLPGSGTTTAPQAAEQGKDAEQKKNPIVMSWIKLSKAGAPWKTVAEMLRTSGAGERKAILTDPGVMKWLSKLAPDMQTLLRLMDWEKQPKKPVEGGQALAGQAEQAAEQRAEQGKAAQGNVPGGKKAKSVMKRDGKKALILLRRYLKKPDLKQVNKRKVWKVILDIVGIWDDHLRADMKPPARIVKMQAKEMMRITMDPLRPWFQRPASIGKVIPRIIKKIKKLLKTPKFIGPPKMKGRKSKGVQKVASGVAQNGVDVGSMASQGVSGSAGQMPFFNQIQQSFGHHDISGIGAHVGGQAGEAAQAIGAQAYAMGDQVAFQGAPSLHTAAHEAAHVVQQAYGAQVSGGVGQSGDRWEQHADAVADAVVAGQSAEQLLDQVTGGGAVASQAVQMKASDAAKDHLSKGYFANYKSKDEVKSGLDSALGTEEKAVHASLKTVDEQMGPQIQESPSGASTEAPGSQGQVTDGISGQEPGAVPVEETAQLPASEKPAIGNIAQPSPEGDRSRQKSDYKSNLDKVQTKKPNLKTHAGPAPKAGPQLTGSADPARAGTQKDDALTKSEDMRAEAEKAVDDGPGPEEVKEKVVNELHTVPEPEVPQFDAAGSIPKADEFLSKGTIPSEVENKTDELGKAQIEASLADATSQIDAAQTSHQAEIDKTKADQEKKQKEMVDKANADMKAEVDKQRKAITDKQKETKDKQKAEVAKVQGKSEEEKAKLDKQVDDRVKADEAAVEQKFADAEKEATAKKAEAEAEAERKKKQAEADAENDSWWDAIGNAVSSAFDALADAVNAVLDAAVAAVNTIVDAAKDFATGLIDACVSFVASALEAYGDLLKGLVDGLLGDIFPGLAAALTSFIDDAINLAKQALNSIADTLKSAVNSLLDAVAGALTGLIEAYKAAINAALALATAVLTGDWEALGKMILEGVLQVAGIDPSAFYALINNAMDSIDAIIQDPGGFVGNLIGAVSTGFSQFAGNLLTHLQTGFFEWLTGPIGEMGITLPTSWDIVGIFGLTMDVIGLNKDGIQKVVTEELGETAGVVFDYVWRYVEALVTGGFDGLWEAISNDLSSLWGMVVDGIKDWILQTIVTQAVLRIATMFNPVGALLNAIMTAYNVYTFVRDEIARIMGVVTAVVDMIASIAAGSLGPAATAIENALASLIPIAISLLANLLGLGGIANKVKEIIEGVQETVQGALRKLIKSVKGMFQGGDGETTPEGDTFADLSFQAPTAEGGGNESHRIYAEKQGGSSVVMIASDAKKFTEQVNNGEFKGLKDDQKAKVLDLCSKAEQKYTAASNTTDKNAKKKLDGEADAFMAEAKTILMSVAPETLEARANIEGGMALTKLAEIRADSACSPLFPDFEKGVMKRHIDEGKTVIQAMRDEVQNSGMKYLQQGAPIPDADIDKQKGLSRVVDLPAIFGYYQQPSVQQRFMNKEDAFCAAVNLKWFDPMPTLKGELRGRMAQAWWFARDTAPSHTVAELTDELAIGEDSPQYFKGMIRFDIPARDAMGGKTFRKPTPYDGMPFSEFRASSGVWGVTAGGALEAVAPAISVNVPAKSIVDGGYTEKTEILAMFNEQFKSQVDAMHSTMHADAASAVNTVFETKTKEVFEADGDWNKVKTMVDALVNDMKEQPLGSHTFGTNYAFPMAVTQATAAFNESELDEWDDTGSANPTEYVTKRKGQFKSSNNAAYSLAKTALNALIHDKTKAGDAERETKKAMAVGMKEAGKIHKEYEPKEMTPKVKSSSDATLMEFSYKGFGGAEFKVEQTKTEMVKSITGTNLSLKGTKEEDVTGRGYTSNSGNRRTANEGMNASHLIPDRLRGSGYKNASNLVTTSRKYNVPIMSDHEEEICKLAKDAKNITMSVSVDWLKWDADKVVNRLLNQEIKTALVNGVDVSKTEVLEKLKKDVKDGLDKKLKSLDSQNLQRVDNVHYNVTYESHDNMPSIPNYTESTNEWDKWLGE